MSTDSRPGDIDDRALADSIRNRWPIDLEDAFSGWKQETRSRRSGSILQAIGIVLFSSLVMYAMFFMDQPPVSLPNGPSEILLAVILGIASVVGIVIAIRSWSLPRAAGLVESGLHGQQSTETCPRCGKDPFTGEECCRRFPAKWSPVDLHGFWSEIAIATGHADAKARKEAWRRPRGVAASSPGLPAEGLGRLLARHRDLIRFAAVGLAVGYMLWVLYLFGDAFSILLLILMFGSIAWNANRIFYRTTAIGEPTRPRCAACRYQLHPPFPDRCQECGETLASWKSITFSPDQPLAEQPRGTNSMRRFGTWLRRGLGGKGKQG